MQYDDIKVLTTWREVVPPDFFTFVQETPDTTYERTYFDRERGVYVFLAWSGKHALHELGHFVSVNLITTLLRENFGLGLPDEADDEDMNVIPELRARVASETLARCIDWRGFEDHWKFPESDLVLKQDGSSSDVDEDQLIDPLVEPLEREWLKELPEFAEPEEVLETLRDRKARLLTMRDPNYCVADAPICSKCLGLVTPSA